MTFSESASSVPSVTGRYFIPDPQFRQYLQIAYPNTMDGDSLIVTMGNIVNILKINNLNVSNLDGIQYFQELKVLESNNNNNLKVIPHFSSKLRKLLCDNCGLLEVIPSFPSSLDTLEGSWWKVSTLPDFPLGLERLKLIFLLYINEIPYLPDSCKYVHLKSVGLGNGFPSILSDTLNLPSLATYFKLLNVDISVFPSLPIEKSNLEFFAISNSSISDMPSLYEFINLKELTLISNSLFVLDSLPFALQEILVSQPLICVKNKPPLVTDALSEFPICP